MIMSEEARILHLPESTLFSYLEDRYRSHIEWVLWQNPETRFTAEELAEDAEQYGDALDNIDSDGLALIWQDLGYPLPSDADDIIMYSRDIEAVVRSAIEEYIHMYDTASLAERIIKETWA